MAISVSRAFGRLPPGRDYPLDQTTPNRNENENESESENETGEDTYAGALRALRAGSPAFVFAFVFVSISV